MRIGKKGAERLLKLSVDLFHPKIKQEEVVVDTTVQEKNITFPTDAKLTKKVIDTCRMIAEKEVIPLRQSYSPTTSALLRQVSNRKTPRQRKKAIKATRRIRTIEHTMVHELLRKMNDKQLKPHVDTLLNAIGILQVLSLTLFKKIPLEQLLGNKHYMTHIHENAIQLILFDNLTGH